MNVLVVGGGLFGCTIAIELAKKHNVTMVEKNSDIMLEASLANHNRLHFGYHYPRSAKTARQCLEGLLAFMMHYSNAVVADFPNYYAIADDGSFVDADKFTKFCDEVGIYYAEEYPGPEYLAEEYLQACFRVREPIFNYSLLKREVVSALNRSNVNVSLQSAVTGAKQTGSGEYVVTVDGPSGSKTIFAEKIVNATYANLNEVNQLFGVRPRELRFEHCIIPIFKRDHPDMGLTVMDGAYCTIMPHAGNPGHSLLWHVDASVYSHSANVKNLRLPKNEAETKDICDSIYKMSSKWMPFLGDVEPVGFFATPKAVEENKFDARTSEVVEYPEAPNLLSVLGGKIATSVQVAYHIRDILDGRSNAGKVLV
tara:strand:+ start:370 stop:1473 length:1104 start_codon:yes stop_codon:yes gene_type:complete